MPSDPTPSPHRWVVFGLITAVYFFVYFHRVALSVIAPDLLDAFAVGATALGMMSSLFFYLYAVEQPVVGHLCDVIGPRRVVAYWSLTAAAGCFVFALAPSIGWAAAGRALIGIGVGGVYVPAMKAFSQWFGAKDFSFAIGMLMAVGNVGAMVATTPLAWLNRAWGWRAGFAVIGVLTLMLAVACLFLIRDVKSSQTRPTALARAGSGALSQTCRVLSSMRFWVFATTFFGAYGTFMTFQGLWAAPFCMVMLEADAVAAANLTMAIPIGFIAGAPLCGIACGRFNVDRFGFFIAALATEALVWAVLVFGATGWGKAGFLVLLLIMGAGMGGFVAVYWSLVRETTAAETFGLVSGLLNPAPFLGVGLFQVWTGAVLDKIGRIGSAYPPEAYRQAFLLCLGASLACLLLPLFFRKQLTKA